MKSKSKIAFIIVLLAIIAVILIVQNIPILKAFFGKKDVLVFQMNNDSSSGIYYKYELDRDDILRETDHYSARHFAGCVHGYSEIWEFEVIGDGEITISWIACENGSVNENMSFYETYLINDKEHTKIFDSRSAA